MRTIVFTPVATPVCPGGTALDDQVRHRCECEAHPDADQCRGEVDLPARAGERQVVVTIAYGRERECVAYDFVVVAIGFEPRWFERILGPEARRRFVAALGGDALERRIGIDLSVEGMRPRLHLPMLAGLAQGPGFPNLSSLGLLSDRILRPYVVASLPGEVRQLVRSTGRRVGEQ